MISHLRPWRCTSAALVVLAHLNIEMAIVPATILIHLVLARMLQKLLLILLWRNNTPKVLVGPRRHVVWTHASSPIHLGVTIVMMLLLLLLLLGIEVWNALVVWPLVHLLHSCCSRGHIFAWTILLSTSAIDLMWAAFRLGPVASVLIWFLVKPAEQII